RSRRARTGRAAGRSLDPAGSTRSGRPLPLMSARVRARPLVAAARTSGCRAAKASETPGAGELLGLKVEIKHGARCDGYVDWQRPRPGRGRAHGRTQRLIEARIHGITH